jgi:hypothetical protein
MPVNGETSRIIRFVFSDSQIARDQHTIAVDA